MRSEEKENMLQIANKNKLQTEVKKERQIVQIARMKTEQKEKLFKLQK